MRVAGAGMLVGVFGVWVALSPWTRAEQSAGKKKGGGELQVGGDYGPIEPRHLIGRMKCVVAGNPDIGFRCRFTAERFEFEPLDKDKPFPPEVLNTLLKSEAPVKKIEGRWKLVDRTLVFSELMVDGKPVPQKAEIKPFRTPVVRVYFGEKQYFFGRPEPLEPPI